MLHPYTGVTEAVLVGEKPGRKISFAQQLFQRTANDTHTENYLRLSVKSLKTSVPDDYFQTADADRCVHALELSSTGQMHQRDRLHRAVWKRFGQLRFDSRAADRYNCALQTVQEGHNFLAPIVCITRPNH